MTFIELFMPKREPLSILEYIRLKKRNLVRSLQSILR